MEIHQNNVMSELLQRSKATTAFKQAVQMFLVGHESKLISYSPAAPRIKIIRVLMKLLQEYPDMAITDVSIQGTSTCSAFYGTLTFGPDQVKIQFKWDCAWKAKQAGFQSWLGLPDQGKAAQVFGFQCFERFEQIN